MESEQTPNVPGSQSGPGVEKKVAQRTLEYRAFCKCIKEGEIDRGSCHFRAEERNHSEWHGGLCGPAKPILTANSIQEGGSWAIYPFLAEKKRCCKIYRRECPGDLALWMRLTG